MLSGEATNTNFTVFGLTRPGLEPTIYHTRGEHANHYTTDVVLNFWCFRKYVHVVVLLLREIPLNDDKVLIRKLRL